MANEVKGPILGTVLLAGVNSAGQPARIDQSALVAGMGSDGVPRWLLVDSSGNVISTGSSVSLSDDAPANVGTAAAGSGTEASRDDHVHAIPDQLVTSRMADLTISEATVLTNETTTSTSYVDLTTVGPAVTLTPGVVQDHLLIYTVACFTSSGGANSSISIAGAAASDNDLTQNNVVNQRMTGTSLKLATAQASGATHTAKYRVSGGTGAFNQRRVVGIAL